MHKSNKTHLSLAYFVLKSQALKLFRQVLKTLKPLKQAGNFQLYQELLQLVYFTC